MSVLRSILESDILERDAHIQIANLSRDIWRIKVNESCEKRNTQILLLRECIAYLKKRINSTEQVFHKLEMSRILYHGHIPTSFLQKAILVAGSSVYSLIDPFRYDMVAVLGETTGIFAAKTIREKMLQDPEGNAILKDQPRINSRTLDFDYLKSLGKGTLGHAYLAFLNNNNVTPDSRRPVHFLDDPELAYVVQRYREVHDLNHTLLGMPTNMLGEIAVKWVEAVQTRLPMCISAALLGPGRLRTKQRKKYLKFYLPWSLNCGQQSKFLMNIYFEKRWQQDLSDLRRELNIPDFPVES